VYSFAHIDEVLTAASGSRKIVSEKAVVCHAWLCVMVFAGGFLLLSSM
jgi:hypothetical protein